MSPRGHGAALDKISQIIDRAEAVLGEVLYRDRKSSGSISISDLKVFNSVRSCPSVARRRLQRRCRDNPGDQELRNPTQDAGFRI